MGRGILVYLLARLPLWLMFLPIAGCTQVTSEPDAVQLMLSIRELTGRPVGDFENPPLEGVEICQTGVANCETTNADGNAALELPANEEVGWTTTKEGYEAVLYGDVTDAAFSSNFKLHLSTNQSLTEYLGSLPTDYPLRDSGVVTILTSPKIAGVTFKLVDATGKRFYEDDDFNPSYDLTATTTAGVGGFVEVGPGDFQVEIGGTGDRCVPDRAWPGDENNRIRVPVRENHFTRALITCPVP